MAKKVEGYIKLQIPAGKATPAPPVGPALGQHGVNIVAFTKEFNARTANEGDMIIPVVITFTQIEVSALLQRLLRLLFSLRKLVSCRRDPASQIRIKLLPISKADLQKDCRD